MKLPRAAIFGLMPFCFAAWTALAGEPEPITLIEARTRALQNNLTLVQARRDEQAARWKMLWAVSEVLPHVSLNSAYSRLDEETVFRSNIMRNVIIEQYHLDPSQIPPFAYQNLYATSISVDQPIYNGGLEIQGLRIAATRKAQIKNARLLQERQIVLEVETAYYDLCRALESQNVQKNSLEISQKYVERFRRRQELGLAAPVDVMRWELQAAGDEAASVDAQNGLELAQLALSRALGEDGSTDFLPADLPALISGAESATQIAQMDSLWADMRLISPDLKIMQANVDLARHNRWTALANFQPKLNFNYTYSWQADSDIELNGFKQWIASISLSMPLFASFGNFAQYQEARVNAKKAQEAAREYELGLYVQLAAAHKNWQSASERLKSALKMREQAQEVLRIQENRSDLGLITNLELLDARNALQQAELSVINTRFDQLIAAAQVRRWAGANP